MKMIYMGILVLVLLNFGVQGFNFWAWQNNPCGYYLFKADCMVYADFLINKGVRFSLNLALIWLIQKEFYPQEKRHIWPVFAGLLLLAIICLFLANSSGFIAQRSYPILHPLVFSPLLGIILLAISFIKPKNQH